MGALPSNPSLYMIKSTFDSKCLITAGGFDRKVERYDWGHGNSYCGFPNGEQALIANRQGVWRLEALPSNPSLYMIKSALDSTCLISFGSGLQVRRYDWTHGNNFCGFPGGEQALIANRQGVWRLEAVPSNPSLYMIKSA